MPSIPSISGELRELSTKELARIKEQFGANGDGKAALLGRTALIESIIERLWKQHVYAESNGPADFAIVALGGFGRRCGLRAKRDARNKQREENHPA